MPRRVALLIASAVTAVLALLVFSWAMLPFAIAEVGAERLRRHQPTRVLVADGRRRRPGVHRLAQPQGRGGRPCALGPGDRRRQRNDASSPAGTRFDNQPVPNPWGAAGTS